MQSSSKRLTITVGILIGMFLAALEATVVGAAMPTVIASLGGLEVYSWVFSAYLLSSTVTVPAWGKLSDIYGRRPLYVLAISIFLAGSMLSGQAQTMGQLIAFRAVQGLGAGGLMPLAMTIVAELYSPMERARVQGYFSGVWGLASLAGPLVGGLLTEQLSWRWIFYLNIPFGLAALLIIGTQLREDPSRLARRRIDFLGIAAFTASLTLFMLLLVRSETSFDLASPWSLVLLSGSMAAMAVFVRAERRAEEPLLPFDLLGNRIFTVVTLNGFLAGMALFGLISFIPLFAQGVMGATATGAASVLTPLLLAWVVFSAVGARLLLWAPFRWIMLAGMGAMVAGFLMLNGMDRETTTWVVVRNVSFTGAGMGLIMITGMIAVQSSVPRERLGIATSTTQFFRSIGGAVGVAVMGAVMIHRMNRQMAALAAEGGVDAGVLAGLVENPNAFLEPVARQALSPEAVRLFQTMLADALHWTFVVGTVVSLLGLLSVALMPLVKLRHFDSR